MEKKRISKFYLLCIQESNGRILKILNGTNFDTLLIEGMKLSKQLNGFWTIFDDRSRFVDGSFKEGKLPEKRR